MTRKNKRTRELKADKRNNTISISHHNSHHNNTFDGNNKLYIWRKWINKAG